jgi:peptide/nickel transport system ATP-binding protein
VESKEPASALGELPESVFSARDLTLRYRSHTPETRATAVDGLTLELAAGEVLAIVGETGSGKSTFAKALALLSDNPELDSPVITGGSLSVLGYEVRGMSAHRANRLSGGIGYLPQEAGDYLSPRLTVGENVALPIFARSKRFSQQRAGEMVATLVDAVRLPLGLMRKFPNELSKGQRQRVAIARALILEPRLLIADDPTAGVDVTVRAGLLDTLIELQRATECSTLIISAELAEVRRVSTRAAVMYRGSIVGVGDINQLLTDPRHPYLRELAQSSAAR